MDNQLTTREKWESTWAGINLPVIAKPAQDITNQLEAFLPKEHLSFIEIGCAPGGWMAYFNRKFSYEVSGLDYTNTGTEITKQNMKLQAINAEIIKQDFFSLDYKKFQYDVVFSGGFVEHFRDLFFVVKRICALSRRYAITMVPNVMGVNGFIGKTFRPNIYAEHNPISLSILNSLHLACGMKTLFCDYVGGISLTMPGEHRKFFKVHPFSRYAVNAPIYIFNYLSIKMCQLLGYTPRSRMLSRFLMYIGLRNQKK